MANPPMRNTQTSLTSELRSFLHENGTDIASVSGLQPERLHYSKLFAHFVIAKALDTPPPADQWPIGDMLDIETVAHQLEHNARLQKASPATYARARRPRLALAAAHSAATNAPARIAWQLSAELHTAGLEAADSADDVVLALGAIARQAEQAQLEVASPSDAAA